MILDKVLRFFITLFMAIAGVALLDFASPVLTMFISMEILKMDLGFFKLSLANLVCILSGAVIGGVAGYLLTPYFIGLLKRLAAWVEQQLSKTPIHDVVAGACGLAVGLIIANLFGYSFSKIPYVGEYLPVIFSIVFGYLGIIITIKKRKEITALFSSIPKAINKNRDKQQPHVANKPSIAANGNVMPAAAVVAAYKLLDTSVIIDGRIADICRTGFLEGTLMIPVFVLEELQHIADSADALKRIRGRRGLDILQQIRTNGTMEVEITNIDYEDIAEVDSKLVRLAQQVGGKIVTNDFNLNKVAQLRGVAVLNINELSNAVKPVAIPGEGMTVTIVKDGKEQGQGVAYLDDGTMIVVENGHQYLNSTIPVEVTSSLQTAAGRMIFAKPKI